MNTKDYRKLISIHKSFSDSDVDRDSVKEYAMTLAKESFGDDLDESIVDGIVDNAIEKSEGDESSAMGIVKSSYKKG